MTANRTTVDARPVVAVTLLHLCLLAVNLASFSSSAASAFSSLSISNLRPSSSASFSQPRSTSASRRGRCSRDDVRRFPGGTSTSPPSCASSVAAAPLRALREATFGMGCFWEPAESLLKEEGVLATTVGYTGAPPGTKPPTYNSVCYGKAWVEAVRVAYDDDILSYDKLLDSFFELQKPTSSRQYASVIFVDDATGASADEKEASRAERWKDDAVRAEKKRDRDGLPAAVVGIEPLSKFYRAEEYHQEYWTKQKLRTVVGVALIAGAGGAYSSFVPATVASLSTETLFQGTFYVGLAWTLVERSIGRDVRELPGGELVNSVRGASES